MTDKLQATQGDIDIATEGEQAVLDAAAADAKAAQDAEKAQADAAAATAEAARIAAEPPPAPPVVAPAPLPLQVPANIIDPALVARNFDAEYAAAEEKWGDGDIDQAEYNRVIRAIAKDESRLEAQRTSASAFEQAAQAQATASANAAAQTFAQLGDVFVQQNPDLQDPTRRSVFTDLVRKVDTETGCTLPDWQLLQETHKRMLAAFPIAPAAAANVTKLQPRGADLAALPPRLAGLPAGPGQASELETLGAMDITDIEDHLGRLTPDARDQLLRKLEHQAA